MAQEAVARVEDYRARRNMHEWVTLARNTDTQETQPLPQGTAIFDEVDEDWPPIDFETALDNLAPTPEQPRAAFNSSGGACTLVFGVNSLKRIVWGNKTTFENRRFLGYVRNSRPGFVEEIEAYLKKYVETYAADRFKYIICYVQDPGRSRRNRALLTIVYKYNIKSRKYVRANNTNTQFDVLERLTGCESAYGMLPDQGEEKRGEIPLWLCMPRT